MTHGVLFPVLPYKQYFEFVIYTTSTIPFTFEWTHRKPAHQYGGKHPFCANMVTFHCKMLCLDTRRKVERTSVSWSYHQYLFLSQNMQYFFINKLWYILVIFSLSALHWIQHFGNHQLSRGWSYNLLIVEKNEIDRKKYVWSWLLKYVYISF